MFCYMDIVVLNWFEKEVCMYIGFFCCEKVFIIFGYLVSVFRRLFFFYFNVISLKVIVFLVELRDLDMFFKFFICCYFSWGFFSLVVKF